MAIMALKGGARVRVTVCDINEERIAAWNSDELPIYEPGLDAIVKECRGKSLFFTTDVGGSVAAASIVFVSVRLPAKRNQFLSTHARPPFSGQRHSSFTHRTSVLEICKLPPRAAGGAVCCCCRR